MPPPRSRIVVEISRVFNPVLVACIAFLAGAAVAKAQSTPIPSPSPPPRQALSDAWWTGPLLAPSAGTLPRGHVLVEPYVFDVGQYGEYNARGAQNPATHSNSYGSLTYIIYGLAKRVSLGVVPVFSYNTVAGAASSSGIRFGDLAVQAQYGIAHYHPGSWIPAIAINLGETFPTGRYDRLGNDPADGVGSGAGTTTVSLYTQTYFWTSNGRILRFRLNASQAFSGTASVTGVSVYGTPADFHGYAKPGNGFTLDVAQEYSITRSWVFAIDEVYHHSGNTQVVGTNGVTNSGQSIVYYLAPAVEYNWTPNVGIIAGVRVVPAGVNTSATLTPVMAINIVH